MAIQEEPRPTVDIGAGADSFGTTLTIELQRADQTALLLLVGELDAVSAPQLLTAADAALSEQPCDRLFLSCEGLTFVDSSGLRALVGVRAACAGTDTTVHLVRTSPFFDQLLAVTGLETIFS